MSVYLIADIEVTNDAWVPEYAANVHDIVEKHGGRYLTRSGNVRSLEGECPDSTLIAIIEFPNEEAFSKFAGDPEYQPFAKARQAGSISRFRFVDDTDIAGTIPYLPKG